MSCDANQWHEMSTEERRNISVDMSALLDDDEILIGTPDVQCSEDMNIENAQINDAEVIINGETVTIGKAVQFRASCSVADDYRIEIVCQTSADQQVEGAIQLLVTESEFS